MSSPELESRIRDARQFVDPHWDARRIEVGLADLRRRERAQAARRVATWMALAALIALGVGLGIGSRVGTIASPDVEDERADAASWRTLELGTQIAVLEHNPRRTVVALARGRAKFDIPARREREYRIEAGEVAIHMTESQLRVNRDATSERVHIEVRTGRARVEWTNGSRVLSAAESAWFPPEATVSETELPSPETDLPLPEPQRPLPETESLFPELGPIAAGTNREDERRPEGSSRRRRRAPTDWRHLTDEGQFERAYEAIESAPVAPRDFNELLLAADAARFSGHPAAASRWLRRALNRDSGEPRAPLAAFTLGRVLLGQLGQPREAARAFARARELAPRGPLAEDALAREVECWSRAGETSLSERRARTYLEHYPEGRRVVAVRRYAGIE